MFLQTLGRCLRGGPIGATVLGLCLLFNLPSVNAQASHGVQGLDRARIAEALKGLNRGRAVGQVAVSPDGKRLAWVEGGRGGGDIRVAPLEDLKKSERVTAAANAEQHCQEFGLAWTPDSKRLAFLSDCGDPGQQPDLYFERIDGKPAARLTQLKGYVEAPAFSPDGTKLAFLYVEGATRPAGALAAMKPPSGVIGEEGVEIQRVAMVTIPPDWKGEQTPARASNRPPGGREIKDLLPLFDFLTPANLHVYEFDWRPDSMGLAYVAADPPGENNWWVAKLYTQGLSGASSDAPTAPTSSLRWVGESPKAILTPGEVSGALHGLQIAVPRWSPDGKAIAFIGGLMSDQGVTGGDVWIVSAEGGQPVDLTPRRPGSPGWIEWDDDEHIYMTELAGGNSQLVRLRLQGDRTSERVATSYSQPVFSIPGTVGDGRLEMSLSATADHNLFVFHASSFDHPMEIYGARPEGLKFSGLEGVTQLSHLNDGVQPGWGKTESLSWRSGKFNVQGWLMLPLDYEMGKKYPLLVEVHGGPAAAAIARWGGGAGGFSATAFSALGYFVLMPNPRGSYGQGEEFTQANRMDFGYGDLADILAGVNAVLAKYPVDPGRVGITGWSYGGFMTMFAVTQTQRFRAAVAGAGISDWQSYYGENSIDQWMTPYFGAPVYDDPAVYAKSSPIAFIKRARTPTLLVVGDRDGECPAPQSYEFWHALRELHVPTQLVVYPNEGHGFVDPAHRRDVLERALEWFARYMPAGD